MQYANEFKVLLRLDQSPREHCVLLAVLASQQCHLIAEVFLSRRKSFHCSFGTITKGYTKLMFFGLCHNSLLLVLCTACSIRLQAAACLMLRNMGDSC